jgi:hypothetical protein
MGKKKHQARINLRKAADEMVVEVFQGKWDHLSNFTTRPVDELTELFDELEKRCPNHKRAEYKETFLRSYLENR